MNATSIQGQPTADLEAKKAREVAAERTRLGL